MMSTQLTAVWQWWLNRKQQRIYIIPTRVGYAYAVLLLIMLIGAINYNNSLGHLLCFLLVSIGHVAMHYSHRNIRQSTLTLSADSPVFCGQNASIHCTLSNDDTQTHYQQSIALTAPHRRRRWQFIQAYQIQQTLTSVEAGDSTFCKVLVPTQQRGWQSIDKVRLSSLYPLGFFFTWTVINSDCHILVYPKPEGNLPLPSSSGIAKQAMQVLKKGDDDFSGFRNYRVGESLHHIAWKALARDELMRSKDFSSPQGQHLILDWLDTAALTSVEAKLSQLCQWIITAEATGSLYALILPQQTIELGHGKLHQHNCLKALALYG